MPFTVDIIKYLFEFYIAIDLELQLGLKLVSFLKHFIQTQVIRSQGKQKVNIPPLDSTRYISFSFILPIGLSCTNIFSFLVKSLLSKPLFGQTFAFARIDFRAPISLLYTRLHSFRYTDSPMGFYSFTCILLLLFKFILNLPVPVPHTKRTKCLYHFNYTFNK